MNEDSHNKNSNLNLYNPKKVEKPDNLSEQQTENPPKFFKEKMTSIQKGIYLPPEQHT